MKLLDLSGASTKIACHAGAGKALYDIGYRPDLIVGVSSGALASIPLAMNLHEELKKHTTNIKIEDFFDIPPVNNKGKIRLPNALYRLAMGKNSLGVQNVSKVISKVVTEEVFIQYKIGNIYPKCFSLAINADTGKRRYFNLKELTYKQYLKAMEATSAIPFATEPVEIDGDRYYDGGLLDHIGGANFIINHPYSINEVVTVFSRPQEMESVGREWSKDIFGVAQRMWSISLFNISKDDEISQREFCNNYGIELKQLFMPKLFGDLYNTNNELLKKLYNDSYFETIRQMK